MQNEIPPSVTHFDFECTGKPFTGHKLLDFFELIYKDRKKGLKIITKNPKPTHSSRKNIQIFFILIFPFFDSDLLSSNYVEIHYEDGKPKFSKVLCS